MARPRKIGLDYFPHDVNASNDDKIEAMRHLYGNDGYAFYFIILENVFHRDKCELCLNDKIIHTIMRKKVNVDEGLFNEMISTACKIGLFDSDAWEKSQVLTSKRIKDTLSSVKRERKRCLVKYRKYSGKTSEEPDKLKKRKEKKSICITHHENFNPQDFEDSVRRQNELDEKARLKGVKL